MFSDHRTFPQTKLLWVGGYLQYSVWLCVTLVQEHLTRSKPETHYSSTNFSSIGLPTGQSHVSLQINIVWLTGPVKHEPENCTIPTRASKQAVAHEVGIFFKAVVAGHLGNCWAVPYPYRRKGFPWVEGAACITTASNCSHVGVRGSPARSS